MAVDHRNNPAGRLWLLLVAVTANQDDVGLIDAWKGTLKAHDLSEQLRRFARVVRLPAEIRFELSHLNPDLRESHSRFLDVPEAVLAQGFSGQNVRWAKQTLREAVLSSLETCSALLSTQRPQPVLDNEQFEVFRQDLEAVRQQVTEDSTLDERTRSELLDRINDLLDSLISYEICGAGDVSKSAYATVGLTVRLWFDGLKSSSIGRTAVIALKILKAFDLLSGVVSLPSGLDDVIGAIGPGSDDGPASSTPPTIGPVPP